MMSWKGSRTLNLGQKNYHKNISQKYTFCDEKLSEVLKVLCNRSPKAAHAQLKCTPVYIWSCAVDNNNEIKEHPKNTQNSDIGRGKKNNVRALKEIIYTYYIDT